MELCNCQELGSPLLSVKSPAPIGSLFDRLAAARGLFSAPQTQLRTRAPGNGNVLMGDDSPSLRLNILISR